MDDNEVTEKIVRECCRSKINDLLTELDDILFRIENNDPLTGKTLAKIYREEFVKLVNERITVKLFRDVVVKDIIDMKGGEDK